MRKFLLVIAIICGLAGVVLSSGFAVTDYLALMGAYGQFEHAASGHDLAAITIAAARQNVFRLNVFAEGVWALLSAIVAAIGVHGMGRE